MNKKIDISKFSESQKQQLHRNYYETSFQSVQCYCSFYLAPFKICYYAQTHLFVIFFVNTRTGSGEVNMHRICSYKPDTKDDIQPASILFHPTVYREAICNYTTTVYGDTICAVYKGFIEIFGKGYSLTEYLKISNIKAHSFSYGFRFDIANNWYYTIKQNSIGIEKNNCYIVSIWNNITGACYDFIYQANLATSFDEMKIKLYAQIAQTLEKSANPLQEISFINTVCRKISIDLILKEL